MGTCTYTTRPHILPHPNPFQNSPSNPPVLPCDPPRPALPCPPAPARPNFRVAKHFESIGLCGSKKNRTPAKFSLTRLTVAGTRHRGDSWRYRNRRNYHSNTLNEASAYSDSHRTQIITTALCNQGTCYSSGNALSLCRRIAITPRKFSSKKGR